MTLHLMKAKERRGAVGAVVGVAREMMRMSLMAQMALPQQSPVPIPAKRKAATSPMTSRKARAPRDAPVAAVEEVVAVVRGGAVAIGKVMALMANQPAVTLVEILAAGRIANPDQRAAARRTDRSQDQCTKGQLPAYAEAVPLRFCSGNRREAPDAVSAYFYSSKFSTVP